MFINMTNNKNVYIIVKESPFIIQYNIKIKTYLFQYVIQDMINVHQQIQVVMNINTYHN